MHGSFKTCINIVKTCLTCLPKAQKFQHLAAQEIIPSPVASLGEPFHEMYGHSSKSYFKTVLRGKITPDHHFMEPTNMAGSPHLTNLSPRSTYHKKQPLHESHDIFKHVTSWYCANATSKCGIKHARIRVHAFRKNGHPLLEKTVTPVRSLFGSFI